MVDVFISYKRDERARASAIARRLQRLGLDVWLDDKIASGTQFHAEIEGALRQAKAILVLWSPGSVKSDWVRNEASFGLEHGNLVAIMLAPCELPVAFRSAQYEPLFERRFKDDHPGWIKVIERIKDLAYKRAEVETRQTKLRIRRKIGRTLQWIGAWLLAAVLILPIIGYITTRGSITPGGYEFWGNWPGDDDLLSRSNYYSFHGAGTWELTSDVIGDRIASPINYVQIECRSEWGVCIEAASELMNLNGIVLNSWVEWRTIEVWSDRLIVARSDDECANYTITINRDTETITALQTRPADIAQRPRCTRGMINQAELPRRKEYRLVDGADRELEHEIARGRNVSRVYFAIIAALALLLLYRVLLVWRAKQ
jgi:hypothetical protein